MSLKVVDKKNGYNDKNYFSINQYYIKFIDNILYVKSIIKKVKREDLPILDKYMSEEKLEIRYFEKEGIKVNFIEDTTKDSVFYYNIVCYPNYNKDILNNILSSLE